MSFLSLPATTVFPFYYTALHLPFTCAVTLTWLDLHFHCVLLIQFLFLRHSFFFFFFSSLQSLAGTPNMHSVFLSYSASSVDFPFCSPVFFSTCLHSQCSLGNENNLVKNINI